MTTLNLRRCAALATLALAGCVGEATDATDVTAGVVVTIESPAEGVVSGTVTVTARATPSDQIISLQIITPGGLTDDDPAPDVVSARWDTSAVPDGPLTLVVRAMTTAGETVQADRTITVDNLSGGSPFSGRVFMVGPVANATVDVYSWSGGEEGTRLGTGVTDDLGHFQISLDVPGYADLVLVRASGSNATHWRPSTNGQAVLDDGRLETIVSFVDGEDLAGVLLTPLTTMAVAASGGRLASTNDPDGSVRWAMEQLRAHVFRPDPQGRDVRAIAPADVRLSALADQGPTAVGLVGAGLDMMASEAGVAIGTLVRALAADLEDTLFDGLDGNGDKIVLGDAFLEPEATRALLAAAVDTFASGSANGTGLTFDDLATDGGVFEDLALDQGPLYPPGAPPGYDTVPPELEVTAPTDPNAWHAEVFELVVTATDKSPPIVFSLELPGASPRPPDTTTPTSATWKLAPADIEDGDLQIEVRGTDALGNVGTVSTVVRVDSTPPSILVVGTEAWSGSTTISLTIEAVDLASGIATVQIEAGAEFVSATMRGETMRGETRRGEIELLEASFEVAEAAVITDVKVIATDHAGNVPTAGVTVQVDTSPPKLKVIEPTPGLPVRSSVPLTVSCEVSDEQSAVAKVEAWLGAEVATLTVDAVAGVATGPVTVSRPEGEATLWVVAFALGGAATDPVLEVPVIIDDTPPSWTDLQLGVLVGDTHHVGGPKADLTLSGLTGSGPLNGLETQGTVTVGNVVAPFTGPSLTVEVTVPADGNLELFVIDVAGNPTDTTVLKVAMDTVGPTLKITSPDDQAWFSSTDVTLSGNVAAPVGVQSLVVTTANQLVSLPSPPRSSRSS